MSVSPALVLAARRGFVESYGTLFQDNDIQRAEDFFDSIADYCGWTEEFYKSYARLDPWHDSNGKTEVTGDELVRGV